MATSGVKCLVVQGDGLIVCAVCCDAVETNGRGKIPVYRLAPPDEQPCDHLRRFAEELQIHGEMTPEMERMVYHFALSGRYRMPGETEWRDGKQSKEA